MASPTFFSNGYTPNIKDTIWSIEQKILGALIDVGGGGSTGQLTVAAGDPPSGSNPYNKPFYWNSTAKTLWVWDGGGWNAH